MDIQTLAQQLVTFLTPFLPHLLKAGGKVAEKIEEKFAEAAWEQARALWGRLRGKERVVQAAQDLAERPEDPDAQAALRLQLKKALEADASLAAAVERLMADEVVQRVLAENGATVREVEQRASGGPTRQEVTARGEGTRIGGVRQIRD